MGEYVKRDDALRALEQINPVDYGAMWDYEAHHYAGECLRDCKEAIDSIPAADVAPVVRCKGCRYRGSICCPAVHETMGNGLVDYAVDDGYCWLGKPKED